MTTKMKDITITTATIDFGDWSITATGQLGTHSEWRIEQTTPAIHYTNDWKMRDYMCDQQELEKFLWEEVQRINQKYSVCVFEETIEQVEDEDYFEEDEN
jgi:hypothetical protein